MRKTRPRFCADGAVGARARGGRLVVGAATLVTALFGLGCGAACDTSDDNAPVRFTRGFVHDGVYESSTWRAGHLPFPGGQQYKLEHHLGYAPASVEIFFGFAPSDATLAPCAGNSCLIRCVDDQVVWIKNDTCAEFWVRVVASGRSTSVAPCEGEVAPASDAGNESNVEGGSAAGDASLDIATSEGSPAEASTSNDAGNVDAGVD